MNLCRVGIIILGLAVLPVYADYKNESEFANNGSIAQILENNINQFLMPKEVQQIGNAIYNEGIVYGALGQEITSSSPQTDFVTKHQYGYCSPSISVEVSGFQCSSQAGNLNNDTATAQYLEMGDVRTSVLLEPLVYNQALDYAAQNYIRNITMPFPTKLFADYISNPETFSKNARQKTAYAEYLANHAFLSVGRYALDAMYASRVPGAMIGGTAASGDAATKSLLEIMETESSRRFNDPNYVSFLKDENTEEKDILRDIAAMNAFNLWMQYQNYRQNERIAALLAASVSNTAKGSLEGASKAASMTVQ